MKKQILFLLLTTLTLTLTGCGSENKDTASSGGSIKGISLDSSYGEVTLCDYKNLTGEKPVYELSEDDIDELTAMFEAAGLQKTDCVVTYCTGGIRSLPMTEGRKRFSSSQRCLCSRWNGLSADRRI